MSEVPVLWFVMRSSGLVSVALLTVAVVLGLLGPCLRPTPRLTAISAHRAASVAGVILLVAHIALAVLDRWITLDWSAAFLPGVAQWERWGTALGAVSVDLLIVILATSAAREYGPTLWRRVHLLSYPAWALAVGHGLVVGSDASVMRVLAMAGVGAVALAAAVRVLGRPRTVRTRTARGTPAGSGVPR